MQPAEFSDLCRALSHELGEPDVEALEREGYVIVDGVAVGMVTGATPQSLDFIIDLGEVGEDGRAEILEEALCINLGLDGREHAVLGLDDETDHLVLTRTVSWPTEPDARNVADLLRRCAALSIDFRAQIQTAVATGSFAPASFDMTMTKV